MKEYNKLMKEVMKTGKFKLKKSGRKNTVKLIHIETKVMYSIHPGKNAVYPFKKWIKQFE